MKMIVVVEHIEREAFVVHVPDDSLESRDRAVHTALAKYEHDEDGWGNVQQCNLPEGIEIEDLVANVRRIEREQ